jgi:hypothetical protein
MTDTLKKNLKKRSESTKKETEQLETLAGTRSVRKLNGLLWRKRRRPVSIEAMDAAIAKGAARSL